MLALCKFFFTLTYSSPFFMRPLSVLLFIFLFFFQCSFFNYFSTNHSVSELETAVALLKQILTRKKPYLEKVIEYTRYKGIAPEQYAEMEAMFKQVCLF